MAKEPGTMEEGQREQAGQTEEASVLLPKSSAHSAGRPLEDLLRDYFIAGLINFCTAVSVFMLTFFSYLHLAYLLVLLHSMTVVVVQYRFMKNLESWIHACVGPTFDDYKSVAKSLGEPKFTWLPCVPVWLFLSALRFTDMLDPDSDAMAAGTAWITQSNFTAAVVAERWNHLPVAGLLMNQVGLPSILTGLYAFFTAVQFYYFILYRGYVRDRLSAWRSIQADDTVGEFYSRFSMWRACIHVADMGNLPLMSGVCQMLCAQDGESYKAVGGKKHADATRGIRFLASTFCESSLQLMFQITLLMAAFRQHRRHPHYWILTAQVASISLSFFTILKEIPDAVKMVVGKWRTNNENKVRDAVVLTLVFVCLATQFPRFIGVFICKSHMFQWYGPFGCAEASGW